MPTKKQEMSVPNTKIVVYVYWTEEETPQLKSVEIVQKVDTQEAYEEIIVIEPNGLEPLSTVLRRLVGDKKIQERVKERRTTNPNYKEM